MTQYIQLLHEQRKILTCRAVGSYAIEAMFRRRLNPRFYSGRPEKARAAVWKLDQQLQRECREFGALRFRVMGANR